MLQMAMAAMSDRGAVAKVARRLGVTTTLYHYVNGDGTPKAAGRAVLDAAPRPSVPQPHKQRQAA